MKEIQKVIICGLGAIGSLYADKISQHDNKNLRILVDEDRLRKYTQTPRKYNGKLLNINYILPSETNFKADLIIIATKYDGLNNAIKNIKNFVSKDTIIMSFLNGITSEEIIAKEYGWEHTLLSYYIGSSVIRTQNSTISDDSAKIVFGRKNTQTNPNDIEKVKNYFDKTNIKYETSEDMLSAYWYKFLLNIISNQPSAILGYTFGEIQNNPKCLELIKKIAQEVINIAKAENIKNTETMIEKGLSQIHKMQPFGKTSMLQDIEAGRKTEVEIFAGTLITLGKKHNIPTPYNQAMYDFIKTIEGSKSTD